MKADVEVAILGAGCAGLSLAAALADEGVSPGAVMLLEPREEYTRDRTWCFWNTDEHPFLPAVSHSWSSWRVSEGRRSAFQQSRRYRYCHIAADDFYRMGQDVVERAPEMELCRGVRVLAVEPRPDGLIEVETDRGRVRAKRVFDSRPLDGNGFRRAALLQRFLGWHVRTAEPCFDPETVDLMRFLPSDTPGRVRFLYLLPFSPAEALVEMTYLDDPGLPEPAYERELEAWLGKRASRWEVLYSERGSLPMGTALSPPGKPIPGVIPIGVRGGRLKPSSGYGFLRIQRHSRAIARALRVGARIPRTAEPGFYGWMDGVFLQAIRMEPEAAPELFLQMFARSEPDALVRFLSERSAGAGELLRVAWSLPKLRMVRAAATPASPCARRTR